MSKVMVSLPADLLRAIDRLASEEARSRSAILAEGARLYLHARAGLIPRRERPEVLSAIATMDKLTRDDRAEGWDSMRTIRAIRDRRS